MYQKWYQRTRCVIGRGKKEKPYPTNAIEEKDTWDIITTFKFLKCVDMNINHFYEICKYSSVTGLNRKYEHTYSHKGRMKHLATA